ncbi:MAG: hypothetical protein PF574_01440 [Candidatus Delongbacteria bacterium]|nr:hypothetical protein [Candidatus Delongbacteria bacterium]
MKRTQKTNELEIKLEILDSIKISSEDEKTKAQDLQNSVSDNFTYAAVRQVEKFY